MAAREAAGPTAPRRRAFRLLDALSLVVGYGLAAVLFRAFWPKGEINARLAGFAAGLYLWLGVAMSGPLLLIGRRAGEGGEGPRRTDGGGAATPAGRRTWAELAWLLIGVYWIVLGVFILPTRLQSFRFGDTILFGLVPAVAALFLRVFGPARPAGESPASWTHPAAVLLLACWPVAWLCLIVLGQALF